MNDNPITIGQGLSNVWHFLFAVEPSDRKRAKLEDPDIEYYKKEFRDIVIYSHDADDETEEERFELAKKMVIKYNNFDIKVFMCEFKERKFYAEDWKEYSARLEKFKTEVRRKRVELISQNPEFYKLFGRTLAKEL